MYIYISAGIIYTILNQTHVTSGITNYITIQQELFITKNIKSQLQSITHTCNYDMSYID